MGHLSGPDAEDLTPPGDSTIVLRWQQISVKSVEGWSSSWSTEAGGMNAATSQQTRCFIYLTRSFHIT